jgi:uncharacterized protein (TIGR02145 family)
MAENLAWLPSVEGPGSDSYTTPTHYVYGYNGTSVTDAKASASYPAYGVLYNWPAALQACPTGWHLPTDTEWTTLENYLLANGYNYDGTATGNKIAKSLATTSGWNIASVTGATGNTDYPGKRNAARFAALPGGIRDNNASFVNSGRNASWWSATEYNSLSAWSRGLNYDNVGLYRYGNTKNYGFSVRCLKD